MPDLPHDRSSLESTRLHVEPASTSNVTGGTLPREETGGSVSAPPPAESERYVFGEEIAHGGMGVILRGYDKSLARPLAFKILRPDLAAFPDLVRRFLDEAQITGQLQHPGVVPIHEIGRLGQGDERPFFAMKLIEGRTLQDLLEERPTPQHELPRFLTIFQQICETVAFAHARGVIHRDLKPSNIMVGPFGEVQVMDWGLAKRLGAAESLPSAAPRAPAELPGSSRTEYGSVLGTYAYMPPEQARGDILSLDPRSDVFGLGAVLCKILTGQAPHTGSRENIREAARRGDMAGALANLDACGADAALVKLAKACLAVEREERPAEAGEVARAVTGYLAGVQEQLRRVGLQRAAAQARASAERKHRHVTVVLAAAVLLLVAAGGVTAWWWQREHDAQQADADLRAAIARRDAAAAVDEAERLQKEGLGHSDDPQRWHLTLTAARSALKRAEHSDDPRVAAVQRAVEEAERDCRLLLDLDRIWLEKAEMKGAKFDFAAAVPKYAEAFQHWGLDLGQTDPAVAGARLRGTRFRDKLLAAVEDCALCSNRKLREHLFAVVDHADPDPDLLRRRWRTAVRSGDGADLVKLAQSEAAQALPPPALLNLSRDLTTVTGSPDAAVQLLRAGLRRHPGDFWLNYDAGREMRRLKPPDLEGAIRCATVTVALRGHSAATHLLLANAYLARGDNEDAIRCYHAALAVDARHAIVLTNLGVALVNKKQYDEAIAMHLKALAAEPHSALVHYNLATAYRYKGDHAAAAPEFREATRLDDTNARYHFDLGSVLYKLDDRSGAARSYETVTHLEPTNVAAYRNLGKVLLELKQFEKAQNAMEKALALANHRAEDHVLLGLIRAARGDPEAAIECYRQAVKLSPTFVDAHDELGRALLAKKDYDGAIEQYQAITELAPEQPWGFNNLGAAYLLKKDYTAAKRQFLEALKLNPEFGQAHVNLGRVLKAEKDFDGAMRAYETGLKFEPKIVFAHSDLGMLYYQAKRYRDAVERFRAAAELAPKNAEIWFNLGASQAASQNAGGAIQAYEKAIALAPEHARAYNNLGQVYWQRFERKKAQQYYEKAVQLNPKDAAAQNNLGNVHKERGELAEAEKCYRAALTLQPRAVQPLTNMGTLAEARGDDDEAIAWYKKAIAADATFPQAYSNLASALSHKDDFAAAVSAARKAVELDGKDEAIAQQLKVMLSLQDRNRRLPAILSKEAQPADAADRAGFGTLCTQDKHLHFTALQFFEEAFAAGSKVVDRLQYRPQAAAAAAQVGCGLAKDAPQLDDAQRARYRTQALTWLTDELAALAKTMPDRTVAQRKRILEDLSRWLRDHRLMCVRDPDALSKLPEGERQEWNRIWRDVRALVDDAERP
jgi:tetratricopeptide (TPR) repeat protein